MTSLSRRWKAPWRGGHLDKPCSEGTGLQKEASLTWMIGTDTAATPLKANLDIVESYAYLPRHLGLSERAGGEWGRGLRGRKLRVSREELGDGQEQAS
jgi:hypothetical protein